MRTLKDPQRMIHVEVSSSGTCRSQVSLFDAEVIMSTLTTCDAKAWCEYCLTEANCKHV